MVGDEFPLQDWFIVLDSSGTTKLIFRSKHFGRVEFFIEIWAGQRLVRAAHADIDVMSGSKANGGQNHL